MQSQFRSHAGPARQSGKSCDDGSQLWRRSPSCCQNGRCVRSRLAVRRRAFLRQTFSGTWRCRGGSASGPAGFCGNDGAIGVGGTCSLRRGDCIGSAAGYDGAHPAPSNRFRKSSIAFTLDARRVLRRRLRFDGVILADDLGMGAIAKRYGPGDAAVQSLQAGTDVAMLCHDWSAVAPAIAAVRKARQEGRFDEGEWSASLDRIERVCAQAEMPGLRPSIDSLGCEEYRRLAEGVAPSR